MTTGGLEAVEVDAGEPIDLSVLEESGKPSLSQVIETGKSPSSSEQETWIRIPASELDRKTKGATLGGTAKKGPNGLQSYRHSSAPSEKLTVYEDGCSQLGEGCGVLSSTGVVTSVFLLNVSNSKVTVEVTQVVHCHTLVQVRPIFSPPEGDGQISLGHHASESQTSSFSKSVGGVEGK